MLRKVKSIDPPHVVVTKPFNCFMLSCLKFGCYVWSNIDIFFSSIKITAFVYFMDMYLMFMTEFVLSFSRCCW